MKSRRLAALLSTVFALGLSTAALEVRASDAKEMEKMVKMTDTNKDGMVSKEEFMKHAEKMWNKMDTKKVGKMDSKQFELFLKELMRSDG